MAKFTVYFKYKAIDSYLFDSGVIHIGRDETNNIVIDSLAVAPAHAAVIVREDKSSIKQLNDDYPLVINGQKIKECELHDGDTITIGKHDIVFNSSEPKNHAHEFENALGYGGAEAESVIHDVDHEGHISVASLQVMNGQNIGKVLSLKKAMTRLGSNGSGVVAIAKRKDGYFVSALENVGIIAVNNVPIENHYIKLNNNDVLTINNVSLLFFVT